ncbi:hypothetical protein F5B22DRAFT_643989 [Xylaria bambusicola]|uniref:uncharacterized protein n=1 Tax=Xylaria bambusicola TaxID=326684 RepID=UPI002008E2AF|nr:uncharacterized protein F5B22DRAFT_643989 [Xylaria bambusicola]KAI0521261.1 hypothetical protein F5B22DRAFT_643989 [Xylaria bambusicola]
MLAQALFSIMAFATQGFALPTSGVELVARQGYTSNCTATYTVHSMDTCNVIRDRFGDVFSLADFYSWNPEVDVRIPSPDRSFCSNLFVGQVVCVGINNSPGTPAACPVPVKPGLIKNCDKCYKVVEGDSCSGIIDSNTISLAELHAWNPDLNPSCTNLEIGYNYCVGVSETLV